MQLCGIPDKWIRIVQALYDGSECAAHEDGEQTRWLKVTTGVNQSCVMSGFLFLLTIDWVIQKTTDRHRNGVQWDFTLKETEDREEFVCGGTKDIRNRLNKQEEHSRSCSRYGRQMALASMDVKPRRQRSQKRAERMNSFQMTMTAWWQRNGSQKRDVQQANQRPPGEGTVEKET